MQDTIAALATVPGVSGIAVIRVSGQDAVEITDAIFSGKLQNAATHTAHYGKILDADGRTIDHAVVTLMRAPHSYTGENVTEISCHGSMTCVHEILLRLTQSGARMAQAGEFTKRAFLNGRMDLSQAEAVIDIINSKNQTALQSGVNQLEGRLSRQINQIRSQLLHIMAWIQAEADFPEEGISGITEEKLTAALEAAASELDALLSSAKTGKIIREGITAVIAGRPNAGKSSLLNALLEADRAIVTDIPGTTRDTVEEYLQVGQAMLRLVDTAGIRETRDTVEKIGVGIALDSVAKADLVLYVADLGIPPGPEDKTVVQALEGRPVILILNKSDLSQEKYAAAYRHLLPDAPFVYTAAAQSSGMDELKRTITDLFGLGRLTASGEAVLTNIRHVEAVSRAHSLVQAAQSAYQAGTPLDFMAIDLESAIQSLGEVTGMTVSEEIVDRIFSEFCVGK